MTDDAKPIAVVLGVKAETLRRCLYHACGRPQRPIVARAKGEETPQILVQEDGNDTRTAAEELT